MEVFSQMRFNKTIKRISALGIGASMVGATIFGAMAADLSSYPSQYIKDGKFTGVLVVGDRAAAEDVIGVSDIVASLQFAATKPAGATTGSVTVEGDAWKVGTSTKILEISENIGTGSNIETIRNITTFIDDTDLNTAVTTATSTLPAVKDPGNIYLAVISAATNAGVQLKSFSVNVGNILKTEDPAVDNVPLQVSVTANFSGIDVPSFEKLLDSLMKEAPISLITRAGITLDDGMVTIDFYFKEYDLAAINSENITNLTPADTKILEEITF